MARAIAFPLLASAFLAASLSSAQVSSQKEPSAPAKRSVSGSGSNHKVATAHRTKRRKSGHIAAAPSYQLHPDQDRYRQIQQALTDRGYFKGEVNGEWNADSVDALKRFQNDQKIDADGKIDAISLKGLGLGARHDGSTAGTVPLSAAANSTPSPAGPAAEPDVPPVSELPTETTPPQNPSSENQSPQ